MKFGVIVYPGSSGDADCYHVVENVLKEPVEYIWHGNNSIGEVDCIIIPGGFSYGDYLRAGAIAGISPINQGIIEFAKKGGLVIGICNGFQVLLEAGLLPGAMLRNASLKFRCHNNNLRVENSNTPFTNLLKQDQIIDLSIAHGEGNYYCDQETYKELEANNQIVFRYSDLDGNVLDESNPNGSIGNIAGICNKDKNVLGMMPHPERSAEEILGGTDGALIFKSIVKWWQEKRGGSNG
ncbi:phosphoribosylformylglycinamidine synthase [Desulfitispora alkaliphila]|uniref:phosphoribosylformylglycinamidine synthase subunit PurQ n=1 Tax=Desulfitispora alkaliphila TaxID=622674 RepID=UPI003D1AB76D